jgi:hypothetical protein
MPSTLGRSDYEDFLIRLYFKEFQDPLQACCRRAYLDFNRTFHGIAVLEGDLYRRAEQALLECLSSITQVEAVTQDAFDDWHHATCRDLARVYRDSGYGSFFVGQGQKWVNMSFKYVFAFGDLRVPGFRQLYDRCHVPLDNILLQQLRRFDFPRLASMRLEPA